MSMLTQFKLFAEYNHLMNQRMLEAAGKLSEAQVTGDRGAFFKSVLGTLNHILVGNIIWLQRFQSHPTSRRALDYLGSLDRPASLDTILFGDLQSLKAARETMDNIVIDWIEGPSESALQEYLSYKNMAGSPHRKLVESLISHIFLHQVHHRGQVTTLISQSKVDFGETNILEIIDDIFA
jgi:uncharacterized damage-inducible protein DinB